MSLDIELINDTPIIKRKTGVFVRKNGKTVELSESEVKEKYPDSNITEYVVETNIVYSSNITHNLNRMADAVGLYECIWNPDENNINTAKELIDVLREGLHLLKLEPEKYQQFNPVNGWGNYDIFIEFVSNYLDACYEYPNAKIEVSR